MDKEKQQEVDNFNDFVDKYYGYLKLIGYYAYQGNELLLRLNAKKATFDKLTENQRIEMMNTDSDFQEFQKNVNKLYSAYAEIILHINEGMNISNEAQSSTETQQ